VVAVLLFTVQVGFYAFLLSFARFSGDGGRSETIIRWLSLVGGALVIGFLVFTLPRTWGKTIATPHWLRDGAKIASALIIAYVLYLVGIMALRQVYPPPAWSPPASLTTWLTVLADLVLAWGLWQDYWWAWYAALASTVYAVFRIAWFVRPRLSDLQSLFIVSPVGV
jgi:hypothetical protein